jgi:hypothetical protein
MLTLTYEMQRKLVKTTSFCFTREQAIITVSDNDDDDAFSQSLPSWFPTFVAPGGLRPLPSSYNVLNFTFLSFSTKPPTRPCLALRPSQSCSACAPGSQGGRATPEGIKGKQLLRDKRLFSNLQLTVYRQYNLFWIPFN